MPAYKTHAIHGELVLPDIDKKVDIKCEDIKTFCFGPDTLIATDYRIFNYQHSHKVKLYFEAIMSLIKENKLQDNSEVMAFLYGQLDHYIVDIICHPLIYYMTEELPKTHKMHPHGITEMWIDDYIMNKYGKKEIFYFHKWYLKDNDLRILVDTVYEKVYGRKNEAIKYSLGITLINFLDSLARNNLVGFAPLILNSFNVGDLIYRGPERVVPLLNLEHDIWTNPITGEELNFSFDDLWEKSIEVSLETIHDVNNYIYGDKPLTNHYILTDSSFNTGFPCKSGKTFKYVKKYK